MANARNQRTTHPRKAARRQRAAERFYIEAKWQHNATYMRQKLREAEALGIASTLVR